MLTGLYSAASAIAGAEQQQEAIAQNLANLNVPGYRRVVSTFAAPGAPEPQDGPAANPAGSPVGAQAELSIDFLPGPYQRTDRSLDVAIDGDGFFVVDSPQGPIYTRDGVMKIFDGRLVNNAGLPYAGASQIPPEASPADLTIDGQGRVTFNGQELGRLEVVQFADNSRLLTAGPTAFAAAPDMAAEPAENATVRQGSRELANVNATQQLVQMLVGMRYHEAAQRSMHSLSDALHEHTTGGQ